MFNYSNIMYDTLIMMVRKPEPQCVEKKREITSGEEKKKESLSRYFDILRRYFDIINRYFDI